MLQCHRLHHKMENKTLLVCPSVSMYKPELYKEIKWGTNKESLWLLIIDIQQFGHSKHKTNEIQSEIWDKITEEVRGERCLSLSTIRFGWKLAGLTNNESQVCVPAWPGKRWEMERNLSIVVGGGLV